MQTIKKLLFLLSVHERKRAVLLLIMITIMALVDTIGIASILPFVAVLTNPGVVETNFFLNTLFRFSSIFGVEDDEQFIFALGICVFAILIISLILKVFITYFSNRFVQMREYTIGKRLVDGYLHQPYSWFLSAHSADLGKTILSQTSQVIANGIRPLIELISKSIVIITVIILLVIINPILAVIVGLSLITVYSLFFILVRKRLTRIGQERLKNDQLRFFAINDAFSAVKEIKVGGFEENYLKSFSNSSQAFARTQATSLTLSMLPRHIVELVAFGGILLIILNIISQSGSLNSVLPVLSLYIFAGYRLIPAIQQVYGSFSQLTYIGPSLDKLYDEFKNLQLFNKNQDHDPLTFNKTITLKNIHYNYPNSSKTSLKNINLTIAEKSIVWVVGPTGSGKTTLLDIILGLLEPQMGTLEVDGKVITNRNVKSWQRFIGYVPQHIYLSDDSISANIAFGVYPIDINQDMVEKSSKIASLHNFVNDELPDKYQTKIGERGVRLSGGQRQRIGIARALYHSPRLLILDEATNALDNNTEQIVLDAINNLSKDITIIIITHRLNTVKNYDTIIKLEEGKIVHT
jgi:ABC-type multidrug transport system fused ATPase/permease subunit